MSNSYFQFKQFRIQQDKTAMKVCTDSCILGAYAPVAYAGQILDIGTGTGLLALMVAQRSQAQIDAVEIDKAAASQATDNVAASPFHDRIRVHSSSIQAYSVRCRKKYDVIITNPPFFSNHLKSQDLRHNVALHNESLQLPELAIIVSYLLDKDGSFIVMLPVHETYLLETAAEEVKLYPYEKLHILQKYKGRQLRIITSFAFNPRPCVEKTLYIKTTEGTYSQDFISLLQPYYLYM
jgi:tRNA1Val (adenine37-N6)-methyltransferase